ncbi:hypothetical protein C8A01DRAFT_21222 [Parachaetomium inaequale]|uniref:Zn(2)-C6 fungal-type domain-containing protein n=1 Tax=Parachaetomium inaequale TaxID=2588326 RepID=A0AAN6P898_9PEZI|nr:hypothetical protein C8A01DRAFT_21222 [Parachaetomium inaequale]
MVNRGRPSRDCFPCRKRKLRCDLRPDGCSQCHRAKLICHGYRDLSQLAFRDETHATAQKVLARQALIAPANLTPLQLGWDVRSRYAFFSIYVMGLSKSCNALAPLYAHASAVEHLHASVDAVSLAFMSCHLDSPGLMQLANGKYLLAIKTLGHALRNPHALASDETLQAVLLLDLYEKMVNRDPRSSVSWMSHVQGAMSLVKGRGARNFSSPLARQLATRVAVTLTISCGATGVPVPEALKALRRDLDSFADNAKWDFTALLVDIVNFRADVQNGKFVCSAAASNRARVLDNQLASLETTLPLSWKPRRVYTMGHNPYVFSHYYNVYPDHFVTQVRNAIWLMRLTMNDIVRRHEPGGASNAETNASRTIIDLTRQICAAVPQFVLPDAQPENRVPFSPLQRLQCYTLLTPLYLAGQLSTDNHMRNWIGHSMEYMAEAGNMKMAKDITDILRTKPDVEYWTVYAMTGSYALAA